MLSRKHDEKPFCNTITGDLNCRSTHWWQNGNESNEGRMFESITADVSLHQLLSEPTHVMGYSKSCIDLISTDPPNLIIKSGVHPSLHNQCHHNIVYGKVSLLNSSSIVYPPNMVS